MHLHRTPRALPRIGTAFGTALAFLAISGTPADAAGGSLYGEGLHIATGALVDPAGRTWVADHNAGFCRMTVPTTTGHAEIEHPQQPGGRGTRTCLGGLLPDAGTGPDAAGQPVLVDPTPAWKGNGDEVALIPDGASPSSEVVRAKWNPATRLFEFLDTVTMDADRGRPTTLSLGPDDAVYVGFQRETRIQRINDPAGAAVPEVVGLTADGRAPQAVAAGRDGNGDLAVYVSETTGLRVLRPDATPGVETTEPAPFTIDPAASIGALFYDLEQNYLYVGTANGLGETGPGIAGIDAVVRVDPLGNQVVADHATGFTMVGGLAKAPNGFLYVLDDPALIDPAEPLGTGRLHHVGLPAAHVTAGPLDDDGNTGRGRHTKDTAPAFTVAGEGAIECRLDGGEWISCGEDGAPFLAPELNDGRHTLSVRAIAGERAGLPEHHRFTVDTKAPPAPRIVRPADGAKVGGRPWFEFASEEGVRYTCVFDAEPAEPCADGRLRTYEAAGDHTLRITATDRAGNVSEPSAPAQYHADPALPVTSDTIWGEGPPSHKGSSLFTGGLHISTGSLVDPNGRTWVADHNGGFCRVTKPGEDGAGAIEHPAAPGDGGARTCLGGLLPEAGTGPDAAGQPVLVDPTPSRPGDGDEMALIPDGASPSSDVVRAQWNPDTGLFEFKDIVTMTGDRARPVAAALGPDGAVYVVFQRSGTVQRIGNPAGDDVSVDVVGTVANGRRAGAAAVGVDPAVLAETGRRVPLVYVAEDTGITQLRPNAARPAVAQPSSIALGADEALVGAMIYDLKRDQLYVGTAEGTTVGADSVHRIDGITGAVEADWLTGYSMIGGLSIRPDGVLYVHDDPALLDPAEPLGTGRLFHVGLPAAHIAPDSVVVTRDRRPAFTVSGEGTVECRLRGPNGLDLGYVVCAADTPWQPADDLADGEYVLTVRSVATKEDGTPVTGLVEAHRFAVDNVAPGRPRILSPGNGDKVGATPFFLFEGEDGATFECRFDAETAWTACKPGRTRTFAANGDHTLEIRAVDAAGNPSPASERIAFYARGVVESVRITAGPEGPTQDASPVFRFASDAVEVQFACRINSRAFVACNSGEKAYTNLADGSYTFEVQGMDAYGNVSVARRRFRVDRTAPVLTTPGIADGAITGSDVTIALGVDESAALTCTLDGTPLAAAQCAGGTIALTGLAAGTRELVVTARDDAGNVATLVRRFTVRGAVPPVTEPLPQPQPTITVVDRATGQPLTIRFSDIDRRVDLDKLQEAGVTVQVIPAQGTKLIRFRIFRLGNGQNRGGRAVAAAAGTKKVVVATIYRRVTPGEAATIRLTRKELRKVTAGRYVLEVTPGRSRSKLGTPKTTRFKVVR